MFQAITDIQLSSYEKTFALPGLFDPGLLTKLRNLKANFERNNKRIYDTFSEDEIKVFYRLVNIFEALIDKSGSDDFTQLLGMIEQYNKGEVIFVDTPEQLEEIANKNKTFNTTNP